MSNEQASPGILGSGSLTGRRAVRTANFDLEHPIGYDENGEPIYAQPPAQSQTIPASCLRVLNSPLPVDLGGGCPLDCPGLQRDGGCLCDIVREANSQGVEWAFEIDERDGTWVYAGPPLG